MATACYDAYLASEASGGELPAARTVRPTVQKAKTALLTAIVDLEDLESLRRRVETWSVAKLAKSRAAVGRGGTAAALHDAHSVSSEKGAYRFTISFQKCGDVAMQMYRTALRQIAWQMRSRRKID